MKPLLIATSNQGKIAELKALLGGEFLCESADPRAPEVVEDGRTYCENAEKKARAFFSVYQLPVLSDDSGLEIDALNGEPGLYSARFGGVALSWPDRWKYVLSALQDVAEPFWTARFRAVLCYFDGKKAHFFEGLTEGRIVAQPKGENGFGYDPIFYSTELGKTFGEASETEKSQVSHRARAAQHFLQWSLKNVS